MCKLDVFQFHKNLIIFFLGIFTFKKSNQFCFTLLYLFFTILSLKIKLQVRYSRLYDRQKCLPIFRKSDFLMEKLTNFNYFPKLSTDFQRWRAAKVPIHVFEKRKNLEEKIRIKHANCTKKINLNLVLQKSSRA